MLSPPQTAAEVNCPKFGELQNQRNPQALKTDPGTLFISPSHLSHNKGGGIKMIDGQC
jgi:hypothetical protein